jgi:hypothetical protein
MYNNDLSHISFIYILSLIITLTITSFLILRQLIKNLKETKVNLKKSTIYLIYYILIVFYLLYSSFLSSVPLIYIIPYIVITIISGFCSYEYSKRQMTCWKNRIDNDKLYVKGGLLIYLIYISALIIRIVINLIFIGYQEISFTQSGNIIIINNPLISTNPSSKTISLIITDLLIMIGVGMLFGRYARVLQFNQNNKNHNKR